MVRPDTAHDVSAVVATGSPFHDTSYAPGPWGANDGSHARVNEVASTATTRASDGRFGGVPAPPAKRLRNHAAGAGWRPSPAQIHSALQRMRPPGPSGPTAEA